MWLVTFRNGSVLKGDDVLHPSVFKRTDEVVLIEHKTADNDRVILDITNGLFIVVKNGANMALQFYGLPQDKYPQSSLSNLRIIYFIREQVNFAVNSTGLGKQIASPMPQFVGLGFQANTKDGRNVKRVVAIHSNGDLDIRDDNANTA